VSAAPTTQPVVAVGAAAATGRPNAEHRGHPVARLLSTALLLASAMLLVAVLVGAANGLRIRVEQTGSMAPTLKPGDLVIVRQTPIDQVRVGDVIGVRTNLGQVIVHRVKRLSGQSGSIAVTTRGDANPTSEQWTIRRTDRVALVQGKVPAVGSFVDAVRGPYTAFVVLIAGLLLALSQLRTIWSRR
jgi:signal peptidase